WPHWNGSGRPPTRSSMAGSGSSRKWTGCPSSWTRRTRPAPKWRTAPCGTPVRSPSCWIERGGALPAAAIVTLVIGGLIIAAAAIGLIRVIGHLRATLATLDALDGGVQVIADRTAPVAPVVESVNTSLKPVSDFAESI